MYDTILKGGWSILLGLVFLQIGMAQQDTILKMDGTKIYAKVIEIDSPKIKYISSDHPDGPIRNVQFEEVHLIQYQNGTLELISDIPHAYNPSNRKYRPFGLGLEPSFVFSGGGMPGMAVAFGYDFKTLASFRLQLDVLAAFPLFSNAVFSHRHPLGNMNLNVQYLLKFAKNTIELVPELGLGVWMQWKNYTINPIPVANVGIGLEYRINHDWGIALHSRYQLNFQAIAQGFISIGMATRFRFGK